MWEEETRKDEELTKFDFVDFMMFLVPSVFIAGVLYIIL